MKFLGKNRIKIFLVTLIVFLGAFRSVYADGMVDEAFESMGNALLFISAKFLAMTGALFDVSLNYTIYFKDLVDSVGMVEIGWELIRDMGNMLFIFVILFMSIGTILGLSKYNIKDSLKNIIIAALLINFSLFFTRVIIDTSNVLAIGFYNATFANTILTTGDERLNINKKDENPFDKGISAIFAQPLNLHTIYNGDDLKEKEGGTNVARNIFTIAVFGSIFILITAFIFLAAGILFIIRTVFLMFLMMVSPIAFIGMILPQAKEQATKWWSALFNQAFFAPVYLMFVYISATSINSEKFLDTMQHAGKFSEVFTGGGSFVIIFNFLFLSGIMIASLIAAKQMGAAGSGAMIKMGHSMRGAAQKLVGGTTFGLAGWLGRKTIGGWAQRKADKWAKDPNKGNTWAGKMALKSLRRVGDSSFDVRNIGPVKTALGKIPGGMGEGIKGGYKTKTDERRKSEVKYAQSLEGDSNIQATDSETGAPLTDNNGNPIMLTKSEAYGKKIQEKIQKRGRFRTLLGRVFGTQEGDSAAARQLVELPQLKRKLKQARTDLKNIKDLKKINPYITNQQITMQEDFVKEIKEKISKINDSLK